MPGCVEGKVALVTGGASGIGKATALTFAREGAKLVIADMHEEGGQQTVHLITEQGGEAIFVTTDVTQALEMQALISHAVAVYGRLDCAYNNAGITSGGQGAFTADYSEERWHQVIAVNLTGVWLCMKYALEQMLHQGGGVIVNTASVAGLVGLPYASAYVASKHGVVGLTKTAALEYATQGIRVNCVCPGYIQTPMTERSLSDPALQAQIIAREPIGRVGTPAWVQDYDFILIWWRVMAALSCAFCSLFATRMAVA